MTRFHKLQPIDEVDGDHTSFIDDAVGIIVKYATYILNKSNPSGFDEKKRVDLFGGKHINKVTGETIANPHVHEKETTGGIRAARVDEIPKRNTRKSNG